MMVEEWVPFVDYAAQFQQCSLFLIVLVEPMFSNNRKVNLARSLTKHMQHSCSKMNDQSEKRPYRGSLQHSEAQRFAASWLVEKVIRKRSSSGKSVDTRKLVELSLHCVISALVYVRSGHLWKLVKSERSAEIT